MQCRASKWVWRPFLFLALNGQIEQGYGLSSEWTVEWLLNSTAVLNFHSQPGSEQINVFSVPWILKWILRWAFVLDLCGHVGHWKRLSLLWECWKCVRMHCLVFPLKPSIQYAWKGREMQKWNFHAHFHFSVFTRYFFTVKTCVNFSLNNFIVFHRAMFLWEWKIKLLGFYGLWLLFWQNKRKILNSM